MIVLHFAPEDFAVPESEQLGVALAAWFTLAVLGGVALRSLQRSLSLPTRPLLPRERLTWQPWGGREVLAALLMIVIIQVLTVSVLDGSGFFRVVCGQSLLDGSANDPAHALLLARATLWSTIVSFPLTLVFLPFLFGSRSPSYTHRLGWTTRRFHANTLLGYSCWLVFTPIVFAINQGVITLQDRLLGLPPEPHAFLRLLENRPTAVDWALILIVAVAVAPVLEELMFRGILQPYLMRQPAGGMAALLGALGIAFWLRGGNLVNGITAEGYAFEQGLLPILFVLTMIPGYFLIQPLARRWLRDPQVTRVVYANALLFAAFHSAVWPSPVPLFFLGLVLGYLAYRTRSLVGPILMHALFNGVSCLALIYLQALGGTPAINGNEATSALRAPSSVSISNTVPGSWLPRRR